MKNNLQETNYLGAVQAMIDTLSSMYHNTQDGYMMAAIGKACEGVSILEMTIENKQRQALRAQGIKA